MVSIIELERIKPVKPPKVNENRKPMIKKVGVVRNRQVDQIVASQLSIFIPVGIAMIEVEKVK